ncbi:MAG: hypothetical protein FOGNACKC_01047 [Anaerolineae bacterium]|nr:hypothetical protein [Anaerolineae bacterium]
MPSQKRRTTQRHYGRWIFLVVLACANLATFLVFWHMFSSTSDAFGPRATPPPLLLLPQATLPAEPTATATRVAVNATAAPTDTPAPSPTLPPTDTPAPIELPPTETPSPTAPKAKHVVIISIDGLRPDALDLAYTPALDALRAKGAYSAKAQTISLSITLPSHASMLTGVTPNKHGIQWGVPYIGWPGMTAPTLLSIAHDAGYSTAMAFGKDKLNYLALPGSVDEIFGTDTHDTDVKNHAIEFIEGGLPTVLFVHLPDTDRVGHTYGWMSEEQLGAVNFADGLIGEIVTALNNGGYLESTLLIVTADHGGHGMNHGDDSPLDRTIPWLAVGPGVGHKEALATAINTVDTAATALYFLGLPIPDNWDGRPVLEIFQ